MHAFLVVVVDRRSSGYPYIVSYSASIYEAPYRIDPPASAAYSCSSLICFSWVCHSNWQEQIAADVPHAEEPDVVGLDAVEPDAMEPDTGEPNPGVEVYCRM
jgi:hypothetical protein